MDNTCCGVTHRGKGYRPHGAPPQDCGPRAPGRPNFQVRWPGCPTFSGNAPDIPSSIVIEPWVDVNLNCSLNPSPISIPITAGNPVTVAIDTNPTYLGSAVSMIVSAAVIGTNLIVILADPLNDLDNGSYSADLLLSNVDGDLPYSVTVTVNCPGGGGS
jgi:hypothetical protein